MTQYIALLRGINVGGKNIIKMSELKTAFEQRNFCDVCTYINSGNALFRSDLSETEIKTDCEELILNSFNLDIPVCIISSVDLIAAAANAPAWWNKNPDEKHNAFFVIHLITADEVCAGLGDINEDYERVGVFGNVIFWSAPIATFSRTRGTKIVHDKAMYRAITVRNANTTLKLAQMAKND